METIVAIVGAGPSGLATAACLQVHSIPSIILEKEDCCASLWKTRSYDRLKLHLAKEFCSLPHFPLPSSAPKFISKENFIQYMDDYVTNFGLEPLLCRYVQSATYNQFLQKWQIEAKNTIIGEVEIYEAQYLVVATGENSEGVIPDFTGLDSFPGKTIHSSRYKSGQHFQGQKTLVIGCGNSGMEIAYDLWSHRVDTSIIIRSPLHILNKDLVYMGMSMLRFFPVILVDHLVMLFARIIYGDLTNYGIRRPQKGPFLLKSTTGKSPVIDVGTINKIKRNEIKVLPGIVKIKGNAITFQTGKEQIFDAIIFATGYKSTANNWLKDYFYVLDEFGMPKTRFPNHWKGENGLYCAGLSRWGLTGISKDAKAIANDIKNAMENEKSVQKFSLKDI